MLFSSPNSNVRLTLFIFVNTHTKKINKYLIKNEMKRIYKKNTKVKFYLFFLNNISTTKTKKNIRVKYIYNYLSTNKCCLLEKVS